MSPHSTPRYRSRRRPLLAGLLLAATIVAGLPVSRWQTPVLGEPSGRAYAAPANRHPILFVDCSGKHPRDTWSNPRFSRPEYRSLWDRLVDTGYTPDRDLFAVALSSGLTGDYAETYRSLLIPAIQKAKAASGSPVIDVVATGLAALASRFYTVSPEYAGDVGTLVMVAAPNQGSLSATLLRTATVAKEAALNLVNSGPLYASRGPDGLPEPRPSPAELAKAAVTFPPFTSEAAYVTNRARIAYEPLIAYYRKAIKWQPRPDAKQAAASRPFEDWLGDELPEVYRKCFTTAEEPPLAPRYLKGGPSDPPIPGEDLTRAYYETVAISAAQQALTKTTLGARAVPLDLGGFLSETASSGDPRKAAVKWLAGLAARLGLKWLAENQQSLAVSAATALSGADPHDIAFDRLVKTDLPVPAGNDHAGRPLYDRVAANYFLDTWNRSDVISRSANEKIPFFPDTSRPGPNVRYVIVAGSVPNPYKAFIPWARTNDLFTEVDSALFSPNRDDIIAVFRSTLVAGPGMLTHNETVQRFIAQALFWDYPVRSRLFPTARSAWSLWTWEKRGTATVSSWSPGYVEISTDKLPGLPGRIEADLEFSSTPPGLVPRAWVYRETTDGQWVEQDELSLQPSSSGQTAKLSTDGFGLNYKRLLLGFRYMPDPAFGGGTAALLREGQGRLQFTARFRPVTVADCDGTASVPPPRPAPPALDSTGRPAAVLPRGDNTITSTATDVPAADTALIKVIRHSKETTHLDPTAVAHQTWVWDFGDGEVLRDENPLHWKTKVGHTYRKPGTFTVSGQSLAADGSVLSVARSSVEVKPAAAGQGAREDEKVFEASSVAPLDPKIELSGPVEWVTGRPAEFNVQVAIDKPDDCTMMTLEVDPGTRFRVIWERPGLFKVAAAIIADTSWVLNGQTVRIKNIYRVEREVNVLALSITD